VFWRPTGHENQITRCQDCVEDVPQEKPGIFVFPIGKRQDPAVTGQGFIPNVVDETLNNFQFGTEHLRVIQLRIPLHRLRMASKERKTWLLFPLVSKSGNRCDAVYLDIKRPRPSRNVDENPRRRVLREEPNVNFIHGGKLLDGRAVNVAL